MERETELRSQLDAIITEYREKVQPIIDELAAIEAAKAPRPIFIVTGDLSGFDFSELASRIAGSFEGVEMPVCNCPACTLARSKAN